MVAQLSRESLRWDMGMEEGSSCQLGKVRAVPGVRAAPPLSGGSVQSGSEGCEGAEQTLELMRAVTFVRCYSGA